MATILLADDISFIKMVQKEVLEKQGYEVVGEASDGIEVIEKYNESSRKII